MSKRALVGVGLGLRWDFIDELVERIDAGTAPELPFLEVTPENHMRRGGAIVEALSRVRSRYPFLSHGLSLSLGSVDPVDVPFTRHLRDFLAHHEIDLHSDHLCFCGVDGRRWPDLLPLPLLPEAARHVAARAREVRDRIGRPFAVENISYYLAPARIEVAETDFLAQVLDEGECGLLLDVNNVYVNSQNFGFDAWSFLKNLPLDKVIEIHVAGHTPSPERGIIIDSHGDTVIDPVLALLRRVLALTGPVPVLLERDTRLPSLDQLLAEVAHIQRVYDLGIQDFEAAGGASLVPSRSPPRPEKSAEDAPRLLASQRAVQWLASVAEIGEDVAEQLAAQGIAPEDVSSLTSYPRPRLGVYGELISRTVLGSVLCQIPRASALLSEEQLSATVRDFLKQRGPRSPYLRDLPFEVAAWASERWESDPSLPSYLNDLARYELLQFAAGTAERGPPQGPSEALSAEKSVWLDGTVHLAMFDHEIHLFEEGEEGPSLRQVSLLLYQDADGELCWMDLSTTVREMVALLLAGKPLGVAIAEAASSTGRALDSGWIEEASALLADLAQRGVLLGSWPALTPWRERRDTSYFSPWLLRGGA